MATIKITQTGSPIRRTPDQRKTLIGLGLNKMHRTRELETRNNPPLWKAGMIHWLHRDRRGWRWSSGRCLGCPSTWRS